MHTCIVDCLSLSVPLSKNIGRIIKNNKFKIRLGPTKKLNLFEYCLELTEFQIY